MYSFAVKFLSKLKKKIIFLDLKLWDIPNTVKTIVSHAIDLGASYITISTLNNPRVFEDLKELNRDIGLLGVTSLTSWTSKEESAIHATTEFWNVHINKIKGCYYNVMGLPVSKFYMNYRYILENKDD